MPLAALPPAWIAPGVSYVVRARPGADGPATLELLDGPAPRPLIGVTAAAGRALTLTVTGLAPGRHRLGLQLPGEPPRPLTVLVRPVSLVVLGSIGGGTATTWRPVGAYLRRQDVVVGSWATAVATRRPRGRAANVPWAPDASLLAAAEVGGVDALSFADARAHALGPDPFLRGLAVAGLVGTAPFGGGGNPGLALEPAVVERGGLRIAFVGVHEAAGKGGATRARIAVTRARRVADVVVAVLDWGAGGSQAAARRRSIRAAHARGAAVVLGSGPAKAGAAARHGRRLTAPATGTFVPATRGGRAAAAGRVLRVLLGADGVRGWSRPSARRGRS